MNLLSSFHLNSNLYQIAQSPLPSERMSGSGSHACQRALTGPDAWSPRKLISAFPMELGTQEYDNPTRDLSHDPISDDFSHLDPIDFFGLSGSLLSSDFLAGIPEESSETGFRGDLVPSNQICGENSTEPISLSPSLSRCHSVVSNPQKVQQDSAPCSEEEKNCMFSALKILQTLHTVPPMCFSAGIARPESAMIKRRTTEDVLCCNKEASQRISKMLTCSCFASFQMQLVLATICHKLIVWYRAMIKNNCNLLDDSSQRSSGSYTRSCDYAEVSEHISYQPITVGEYAIDTNLQPKVQAQVVFGELQHLEIFTRNFSSGLGSIANTGSTGQASAPSAPTPDQSKTSAAIHHHLIGFLDEQLRAARAEVIAVLSDDQKG